jgi:hypothetical protein
MEKGFEIYNKIVFTITMITILILGFVIKNSNDIYFWYRLLNVEAVLISIWTISTLEIITNIYFKINLRDYINFIIMITSVILVYLNRDYILHQPNTIDLKYISIKFGAIGATFYILPFLLYGYNKNIKSILKVLSLFSAIYIYSQIFTDRYKISTVGFIITAIFLVIMYILSMKENSKIKKNNNIKKED